MPWRLLTVSVCAGGDRHAYNLVTDKDPLLLIVRSRAKFPQDDMILLASVEIEDSLAARWCKDENWGEVPLGHVEGVSQ